MGAGILMTDLLACSPTSKVIRLPVTDNVVRLPVTSFTSGQFQIIRPEGWFYDIAVRKNNEDEYEALLLECTHQQNQLIVNQNGFKCILHGSQFDLDGRVVKGPAERALTRFFTRTDQGQVIIQLKS